MAANESLLCIEGSDEDFDLDIRFAPVVESAIGLKSDTGTCASSCGGTCSGSTCYGC
jgi:hypothetical protein